MRARLTIFSLRALAALLVVALLSSSFAHRSAAPAQQDALDAAFMLALSPSDICGDTPGKAMPGGCEACRLHAAMALPDAAVALIMAELSLDPVDWMPQPPARHALTAEAVRPARAPPAI